MAEDVIPASNTGGSVDAGGRQGDVTAMLHLMGPLHGGTDPVEGRRRLLADLCRLIGVQFGAAPAAPPGAQATARAPVAAAAAVAVAAAAVAAAPVSAAVQPAGPVAGVVRDLSPKAAEVLRHLLDGDSEKQVARRMQLSHHTVHGHVKVLYRRFGVSSRAELLALHVRR